MSTLPIILQSSRFNLYSGALLAAFFGIFAYAHFLVFLDTGKLSLLLIIISEALTTVFFIFRSNPKTVSVIPSDWVVAIIGSFAPLFLRPADYGVLPQAEILIALGTILQIAGLISLNRSFAIVAAKREIKTGWMYRMVRHPLYASYFLIFGGYVLVHTTTMNLILYLVTMSFLCLRIFREERHLSLDPAYRHYMLKVRYRIIPYIF
ncbi:methyltransferase family protein [Nitrosomonas ureae]|uniref:Protein-S-isoprenylcysteine O-methyltransferase Ste14 n=1 Tax=Nitrosomonas ureae TaxID=44577 RepID=A0A1H5RLC9_9PROT|nr:methyltransferase [Nitrosomonas ureae]SEF39070.1 Protein-S-isoprenylcysteine O-methyltransferase Ste14 [Nitrosomonas ureae]